jgi:hypothetical protein
MVYVRFGISSKLLAPLLELRIDGFDSLFCIFIKDSLPYRQDSVFIFTQSRHEYRESSVWKLYNLVLLFGYWRDKFQDRKE